MSNFTNATNATIAMVAEVSVCDPSFESCSGSLLDAPTAPPAGFQEIFAVGMFLLFDFFLAVIPVINHYAWIQDYVAAHTGTVNVAWGLTGASTFLAISYTVWIVDLLIYSAMLLWTIFAFFPHVFGGARMLSTYLNFYYYGVLMSGGGLQAFNWLMLFMGAAAVSPSTFDGPWIYTILYMAMTTGFYMGYLFLMPTFQTFYVEHVYWMLKEHGAEKMGLTEIEEAEESSLAPEESTASDEVAEPDIVIEDSAEAGETEEVAEPVEDADI